MTPTPLPLAEVTRRAIEILARELGPVDTIRFIGQYTNGAGDYTAERDRLFADLTAEQIVAGIKARRAAPPPPTSTSGPSA